MVFDRPRRDLLGVPVGPPVAVAATPIPLLEKALVLPLELVVEDYPLQPAATTRHAVRRLAVGAIHLGVVLQFARLPHACVERLAGYAASFARPAIGLQQVTSAFGERHDPVPVTGPRNGLDEAVLAKMPQVGGAVVTGPTEAGFKVVRGDDSEGPNGRKHPALTAIERVVAAANADRLATRTTWEIDVADGNVTLVAGRSIWASRSVLAVSAPTQVEPSIVTVM